MGWRVVCTSSRQLGRFLLLPSSWSDLSLGSFSPLRVILVAELHFLRERLTALTVYSGREELSEFDPFQELPEAI